MINKIKISGISSQPDSQMLQVAHGHELTWMLLATLGHAHSHLWPCIRVATIDWECLRIRLIFLPSFW